MVTSSGSVPFRKSATIPVPANLQAATNVLAICKAPLTSKVLEVTYTPNAAITGANTNSRTLSLINKGQDGTGTTVIASLSLTSGVNAAAFDLKLLTLSGTPANLLVTEGDVLAWSSAAVGSGLADPGGSVVVAFERG